MAEVGTESALLSPVLLPPWISTAGAHHVVLRMAVLARGQPLPRDARQLLI